MPTIIESARGPFLTLQKIGIQPLPKVGAMQPETGCVLRRITDAAQLKAMFGGAPLFLDVKDGDPKLGLTNGYSRFQNTSFDGKWTLAFGTSPYAVLYDKALNPVRVLFSPAQKAYNTGSFGKIGDAHEVKWNPADGKLYYVIYDTIYRQDAETGTEEMIMRLPAPLRHTSDGCFDASGRYIAYALVNGSVVVIDILTRRVIQTVPFARPNGVDVSPSGKYLKCDNQYFWIGDGSKTGETLAGHGGWSIAADGRECFVSQHNGIDWIAAYFPDNGEIRYLMRMPGMDGTAPVVGMHAASEKHGLIPGCSVISFYGGTSPLSDNVILLEIVSQKKPGCRHPKYGGDLKTWQEGDCEFMPRIKRICHMQNQYMGSYFSEAFANINPNGSIGVGANWSGTDGLELYRIEVKK